MKKHRRSTNRRLSTVELLESRLMLTLPTLSPVPDLHIHDHVSPRETSEVIGRSEALESSLFGEASAVPTADTFKLHSNPSAGHTIYIDFDGHVTVGTTWNSAYNINTINSPVENRRQRLDVRLPCEWRAKTSRGVTCVAPLPK